MNPYILVLGASIVDIFGLSKLPYQSHNSTPGEIKMSFGGVCRNIAENLAKLNMEVQFISVIGNDEKGRSMLEHSKIVGYDMSHSLILESGRTPTYMAILDEEGEMVSAIVDMDSISEMDTEFIDSKRAIIENATYTFLDADNPDLVEHIIKSFPSSKFILDPISAAKSLQIKHLIKHFHTIKPNRHEAEVLCGFPLDNDSDLKRAGDYFIGLGIKNVFISLDEEGIYYTDGLVHGRTKALDIPVKNVTGAGDSFVAGLGYSFWEKLPMKETVKFAMALSIITIAYDGTINPKLNLQLVEDTISKLNWIEYEL